MGCCVTMGSAGTPRAATAAPAPRVTCSAQRQTPVKVRNLRIMLDTLFIVSHQSETVTGVMADTTGKERAVILHKCLCFSFNFSGF